jgi:hypothetical protein
MALALAAVVGVASASANGLTTTFWNGGGFEPKFTAESYPAEVTGKFESIRFSSNETALNCPSSTAGGEKAAYASNTVFTTTGIPSKGCSIFGFEASVNTNGCFHWHRVSGVTEGKLSGLSSLGCPPGVSGIEITPKFMGTSLCTYVFPGQVVGEVAYTNGSKVVEILSKDFKASKFTYTIESKLGPGACGGTGVHTDGIYYPPVTLGAN